MKKLQELVKITCCSVLCLSLQACSHYSSTFRGAPGSVNGPAPTQSILSLKQQQTPRHAPVSLAKAKQFFVDQNYELAFQSLLPLANQGDPDAQYGVGYLYYYGKGIPTDRVSGVKWIQKSAAQGFPNAVKALELLHIDMRQTAHNEDENSLSTNPHSAPTKVTQADPKPVAEPEPLYSAQASETSLQSDYGQTQTYQPSLGHSVAQTRTQSTYQDNAHPVAQTQDTVAQLKDMAVAPSQQTYGPTRPSDTLWSIASKVRPNRSVTVQQMMMAILRRNPDAFASQNVNDLKKDMMLVIPDVSYVKQYDRDKTLAEMRRQENSWQGY